jgi:hypothetical protein
LANNRANASLKHSVKMTGSNLWPAALLKRICISFRRFQKEEAEDEATKIMIDRESAPIVCERRP